jgi:hypothetical protein
MEGTVQLYAPPTLLFMERASGFHWIGCHVFCKTWSSFFIVLLLSLPLCLLQVTKNSAWERMKKLSNLGWYHRLTLFVIRTFTCSHLEDEERDWLRLGRLWGWKVVRICLGQVQLWALVLEVLKVHFLHATTALFTSLFRNSVNSANAHHDLGTMLIHMLMIVEMFVIVVITLHHCYDGHYPFSEMYLCPWHSGSYSHFQGIGCQCKHLNAQFRRDQAGASFQLHILVTLWHADRFFAKQAKIPGAWSPEPPNFI